jgi:hypothetical protein
VPATLENPEEKTMKKMLTLILALAVSIPLALPAAAQYCTRQADIDYCGIRITLDGAEIIPADAAGNPVEPFAIEGTTYLPVRAVAGALGLNVAWNGGTSTVALTSGGTKVSGSGTAKTSVARQTASLDYCNIKITINGKAVTPKDASGKVVEPFAIAGTTYLPVRAVAGALGLNVAWNAGTSTVALTARPASGTAKQAWRLTSRTTVRYSQGKPASTQTESFSYDAGGRLVKDVSSTTGNRTESYTETYTCDAGGRMAARSKSMDMGGGAVYTESFTYAYNSAGKLVGEKGSAGGQDIEKSYTYDSSGRMTKCVTLTTSYGEFNEPGKTSYTSTLTENYTYKLDKAGRVISRTTKTDIIGGETTVDSYTYDSAGRTASHGVSYVQDGTTASGGTEHFSYDANGNMTYMWKGYDYSTQASPILNVRCVYSKLAVTA